MVKRNRLRLCLREQTADIGGVADDRTVGRALYALLSEVDLKPPWKPESGVEKFQEDCKKKSSNNNKGNSKENHLEIEKPLLAKYRRGRSVVVLLCSIHCSTAKVNGR